MYDPASATRSRPRRPFPGSPAEPRPPCAHPILNRARIIAPQSPTPRTRSAGICAPRRQRLLCSMPDLSYLLQDGTRVEFQEGKRMGFPVVFEHMDACGISRGRSVMAPAITAAAVTLVSLGAEQILVPGPSSYEEERAAEGIARLPKERRSLVKVVDR